MITNQPKGPTMIDFKLETITPKVAAQMLEYNYDNRNMSQANMLKIANDIKKNKWVVNYDTILVAEDNRILNGQHRLRAVISANKPIKTYVVRNIPLSEAKKVYATVDIGKSRSSADILSSSGVQKYAAAKASSLRFLYGLDQGRTLNALRSAKIANQDIMNVMNKYPGFERQVEQAMKHTNATRILTTGVCGCLFYYFGKIDEALRDSFFRKLDTGAGLDVGDPVLALREKLQKLRQDTRGAVTHIECFEYAIAAWNACRAKRRCNFLKLKKDEYTLKDIK